MQDFYSRVLEEVDPQGSGRKGRPKVYAWTALAPHVEPVLDRLHLQAHPQASHSKKTERNFSQSRESSLTTQPSLTLTG